MFNTYNQEDRELLDAMNEIGYGDIELPISNGCFNMDEAKVHENCKLDQDPWVAKPVCGKAEPDKKQVRLLDRIHTCVGKGVAIIKVVSGMPMNLIINRKHRRKSTVNNR